MIRFGISFFIVFFSFWAQAQNLYFPPLSGDTWETTAPSDLGWCPERIDSLYQLLETGNTKAFILLKDGKIVLERYFNGHNANTNWQWASAGKTLTAFAVGMVQDEGLLDIQIPTSAYLSQGWTSCSELEENKITVLNQLTMTSGLEDGGDPHCTEPSCLTCLTEPNVRWAYHNGPYTLLTNVLENATGQTFNQILNTRIKTRVGMQGLSVPVGDNRVYFSTARSMARFGLLNLNQGVWDGDTLMHDAAYFNAQMSPSQNINPSYGYLWWLNGQDQYMLPSSQIQFQGSIIPAAPTDMVAGIGADGQYLCVVPSENMVVIRMGQDPDASPVPTIFLNQMWTAIHNLDCSSSSKDLTENEAKSPVFYPNPSKNRLFFDFSDTENTAYARLFSMQGKLLFEGTVDGFIERPERGSGVYLLELRKGDRVFWERVVFGQ